MTKFLLMATLSGLVSMGAQAQLVNGFYMGAAPSASTGSSSGQAQQQQTVVPPTNPVIATGTLSSHSGRDNICFNSLEFE